ncbi:hypothetical protein [Streptomyces sp. NPDC056632]
MDGETPWNPANRAGNLVLRTPAPILPPLGDARLVALRERTARPR